MSSIKDRLATAKLPERSVQVCLRGDLGAQFDELERQLRDAKTAEQAGRKRIGSVSPAREIAEQMETLREQMAAEMLDLRVRALPRAEWRALTAEYPPGEDENDQSLGVDFDAFMGAAIPRCVVEPDLDAEDWEHLNNVLSSADYERLLNAVWLVNRTGVDIPKSRLASLVMAESGDGSK